MKRRRRVRQDLRYAARPRISVFRSNRGISAQLIDDVSGRTLAAVAWYEPDLRKLAQIRLHHARGRSCSPSAPRRQASPTRCSTAAATSYHGHVRAFAEAMREAGMTV